MYPEEELEDSMGFIEKITLMTTRSPSVNVFLADLLNNIRNDCESEFVYPKLTECLKSITGRYTPYYLVNFKVNEGQMKLLAASLCLSGKETFLARFDEIISILLSRIREKIFSNDSILIIAEMLSTYYNRYPDAWATLLDRTESILSQIFPIERKNVLGCEDGDVGRIVEILAIVSKKLPRFCYNEIIKRLIKQSHQSYNNNQLDNFPWDRVNIALQTFLQLCSSSNTETEERSGHNLVWKSEYSKVKIGDLELEAMSKEISDLIRVILAKLTKQFWQGHLNQFNFDSSKTKLISFLKMILAKYLIFLDSGIILNLTESSISDLAESAKKAFKSKKSSSGGECEISEVIHKIGNMIFGQGFKLDGDKVKVFSISEPENENEKVYKFFEKSFNRNSKTIPNPPANLQENIVLRGGIFYILESLTSWSQTKLLDPTAHGKLDENEIELFGRIVDVYFKLLVQYEALVKTVYLEKQNDKNIILRSWSSMVGFKRNSKEIADFLASLLGYSDEKLRWRIIESFSHLPSNRFGEFMKLFEKFRLAVSEDFVNLKRNRRNEKSKIEITRLYKNVLKAWNNPQDNLTPLRMILRHVIEVYYYVSKNEVIDEFIWTLRGEFCGLLGEYLRIINSMQPATRKSFLPLKFHLEVWLTVDEWLTDTTTDNNYNFFADAFKGEIDGLFVNFAYDLIEAVSSVDRKTLPTFIDNLLVKISSISSDNNLKIEYVYNLMKSSIETDINTSEIIFLKFIEFKGSGRDFDGKIEEGIQRLLEEEEEEMNIFKGPALDLFKLMLKTDFDDSVNCDLKGVLEMFHLVSDAKMQKRILSKIKKFPEIIFDEKFIEILFDLTTKLMETFPDSLKTIWNSTTSQSKSNLALTIHFIQKLLQADQDDNLIVEVCGFIYGSIEAEGEKENILLRYAHPFSGTQKYSKYSPLEAVMKLIPFNKDNVTMKSLYLLMKSDSNADADAGADGDTLQSIDANELIKWAVECPLSKISYSAWRELKRQSSLISDAAISDLLKKTKLFLQHLVCPATLNYFDSDLVKEILEFFSQVIQNNDHVTEETFNSIFEMILVQLLARDTIVFETICDIIKESIPKVAKVPTILYCELSKRSSISIDLLYQLLIATESQDSELGEKYFYCLIGILPYLFRLFEESLNVTSTNNGDYKAEVEYLRLLGQLSQRIIIGNNFDENGILCLLELNEFLTSIAKMKKRPAIDFYKTFATILASDKSISDLITRSIFSNMEIDQRWDQFLVYYFDSMRIKATRITTEDSTLKIANVLAESSEENCQIRQRVIDYLINSL